MPAVESFAFPKQHAVAAGNAELETRCDPARAVHETVCYLVIEQIPRGLLEQAEPAIEVPGVDGQWQMHAHRLAVIIVARQYDGRPECAHALQVGFPVVNARTENGPEQVIRADARIEAANELLDHGFVDAGLLAHLLNNGRTTLFVSEGSVGHPSGASL